jgi:hypothetical protein
MKIRQFRPREKANKKNATKTIAENNEKEFPA